MRERGGGKEREKEKGVERGRERGGESERRRKRERGDRGSERGRETGGTRERSRETERGEEGERARGVGGGVGGGRTSGSSLGGRNVTQPCDRLWRRDEPRHRKVLPARPVPLTAPSPGREHVEQIACSVRVARSDGGKLIIVCWALRPRGEPLVFVSLLWKEVCESGVAACLHRPGHVCCLRDLSGAPGAFGLFCFASMHTTFFFFFACLFCFVLKFVSSACAWPSQGRRYVLSLKAKMA